MSSATQSSSPSPPPLPSPDEEQIQQVFQKELSENLRTLQHDPTLNGIWALGKDGIMRSLTADREVVDAVPLRPELIKALVDRMPYRAQNEVDYRGVDGTNVPREQWFHPDKSLLPPPYTPPEDRRNPSPGQLEKNRQFLEERAKSKAKGDSCEPRIVSNHDLGLKG